jgi:hypothetical protein
MSDVLNVSPSALVDEFLTKQGREVIEKMFLGFETAGHVTKFPGIDETMVLAQMDVIKDLIYEYNPTLNFTATDDAIDITDVRIKTYDFKVELRCELNARKVKAYKAYLKGAGLSMDDMHFLEYLNDPAIKKMMSELEDGVWQAVEDTTPANIGLRKFAARFDGYRKIALDAGVAGKATVVATGAITVSNAVAKVNQFYRAADKTMKQMGFNIYCSYTLFEDYLENYAATHQGREIPLQDVQRAQYTFSGIPITLGGKKTFLVAVAGFGDDDALIGTRPEFLAFGFNVEGEMGEWKMQDQGWFTHMLNKFPVGVQILLKKPGFLLVNDQL